MRILSKFHDYYDSCLAYGADPKCIYLRETTEIERGKDWPSNLQLKSSLHAMRPAYKWYSFSGLYETGCIWFCGKAYPFVIFPQIVEYSKDGKKLIYHEQKPIYCYDFPQLESALRTYGTKKEIQLFELPVNKLHATRHQFRKFFEDNQFSEKEVTEFLCKAGIPCLAWTQCAYVGFRSDDRLLLNPPLKNFQFFRVRDTFSAFQDLSMFISGVMGGSAPPMVPISDEIRKEKHGFDEWSFRKKVR